MFDWWWKPMCRGVRLRDGGRGGMRERCRRRKKQCVGRKKKQEHLFSFDWGVGIGYKLFLRPVTFEDRTRLNCLHPKKPDLYIH